MIRLFRFCNLTLYIIFITISALQAQNNEVRELYQEAKNKCHANEWTSAISLFEELIETYPDSKYQDDALFWIAYSLEMMPDHKNEAFMAFARLIETYPKSTWVDDAAIHQIQLAENFVMEGKENYRTFLYKELKEDLKDIQFRAAIALGRIGDPHALPVLRKMEEDADYGTLARDLAAILQINRMSVVDDSSTIRSGEEMDFIYKPGNMEAEESTGDELMWFGSARYEQYRSMLKKETDWSEEELIDFGLWHILSTEKFEEYHSLKNDYDKKEWQRKYWKKRDPTPTSPENETKEEFIQRVQFARAKFSELWDYSDFKYMPDQFLRPGELHAPWDARGELYIKYGEPAARSEHSWKIEVWTYYRYGVDFRVHIHMTNIYGKAIHAGELSLRRYNFFSQAPSGSNYTRILDNMRSVDAHIQANFIYNNEMRFEYDYGATPIKNISLTLESASAALQGNQQYQYQIQAGEFNMLSSAEGHSIRYKEVYCIVDEDYRDVARNEMIRNIGKIPDDEYLLKETIVLNLPPGKYTLFLRLEDQNDTRLGIFSQDFQVEKL